MKSTARTDGSLEEEIPSRYASRAPIDRPQVNPRSRIRAFLLSWKKIVAKPFAVFILHRRQNVNLREISQIRRKDPGASPQTPPEDLSSGHLFVLLLFTQRVKSKRTEETRKLSPAADAGYGRDSARFKPADWGRRSGLDSRIMLAIIEFAVSSNSNEPKKG